MVMRVDFPNLYILDHPLISHKLTRLRDETCGSAEFRRLLGEISTLMIYEVTADLPMTMRRIRTPLQEMDAPVLACKEPVIVPILRAGLGLVDGPLSVMPDSIVAHVGVCRDHDTHLPHEYLVKLPPVLPEDRSFLVVDPMLATAGSSLHVTDILVGRGVAPERIKLMVLLAAPEGVRAYHAKYPQIPVYSAVLDSHLNENAYIVPGLGDAGDRMFGTN